MSKWFFILTTTYPVPESVHLLGDAPQLDQQRSHLNHLFQPHHAAEASVAGRGVERLGHARGRPVAPAVVRRAQERAAFHHLAPYAYVGLLRIVAALALAAALLGRCAAA